MAIFTHYPAGQFCWIDLMSREPDEARTFLCKMFGWTPEVQDTQGGPPYTCFTYQGHQVCGFGEMNPALKATGMPSVWSNYVHTEDVEATVAKAVELGGAVMMPAMDVMDSGRMAILTDPTGAVFSIWQPKNHCGSGITNVPNTWSWSELITRDVPAAIKFYEGLFGWDIARDTEQENEYWTVTNKGRLNAGIMPMPPDAPAEAPAHWGVYFSVEDLDAALKQLKELGGQVIHGPFTVAVGHIAVVSEPSGSVFQLIQMTVPCDEAP